MGNSYHIVIVIVITFFLEKGDISYRIVSNWKFLYQDKSTGLFPLEFEELDITKLEMVTVMAAIKHWFAELENLKVRIFVDNQACVALLNYGITKSPFLAACLREIAYFLAQHNIEIQAEYIPSKVNVLADLCSRAFSSDVHYKNFNNLLNKGIVKLDQFCYSKLYLQIKI